MDKLYIHRGTETIQVSLQEYYDLHAQVMQKNYTKEELNEMMKLVDTDSLTEHGKEVFKRVENLLK